MVKLELAGRVARDAEVFTTKTGSKIVNFSVAVSVPVMKENQACFFEMKAFSPLDGIASELMKGDAVYIVAEPRTEKWERDGKSHSKLIWIPVLLVPYQKDANATAGPSTQRAAPKAKAPAPEAETETKADEDDVPFAVAWWLGLFIPVAAHAASLIT